MRKLVVEAIRIVQNEKWPYGKDVLFDVQLFPSKSFQLSDSVKFFKHVKLENLAIVIKMVKQDPLLVF